MSKDKQRGWVSDGRPHDVPAVIKLFGFGPQEGAQWGCKCGGLHPLLRTEDGLRWDTETDLRVSLGNPQPGDRLYTKDGAKVIPHDRRQFINGLADACHADDGNAERDDHWMINRAVAKMEQWGYIAFPKPVVGATVEDSAR